jgi:glutathionylspermidine synthase
MSGQVEDYVTAEYLRDTAIQAGFETFYLDVEQIGLDSANDVFVDPGGRPIDQLFKLYPWSGWPARSTARRCCAAAPASSSRP